MSNLTTTMFTASNLCHEIANYLSVMKFMQEDVEEFLGNKTDETVESLFKTIDQLTLAMDFFRNLYSPAEGKNEVLHILLKLYKIKGIKISGLNETIYETLENHTTEKIYSAILYVILKSCRDTSHISVEKMSNGVNIICSQDVFLKDSITEAFNSENPDSMHCDNFNILAVYANQLAESEKYTIKAIQSPSKSFMISIWKR